MASLCYARQRTTDNGQRTTDNGRGGSRNYGTTENWLRFAMPDNRLQTTDNGGQSRLIAHASRLTAFLYFLYLFEDNGQRSGGSRNSELRNYGFTELRKLTSLCYAGQQTTDNIQTMILFYSKAFVAFEEKCDI